MAAAGSRHVMESYVEVNDGPAVTPRGGVSDRLYACVPVDHTHALRPSRTHLRRQMSGRRVMHVAVNVSDKPKQSGKTRSCCVITN